MSILELGSLQLTLFAMMLTGALLKKKGIIDENGKKCLSDLCISVVIPCNIFKSCLIDFNADILRACAALLASAVVMQLFCLALNKFLYNHYPAQQKKVLQYCTIVPMSGFLGNPIDVGLIPGGTYVLYDDGAEVILTATRNGLSKDSDNAKDWNDGQPTEASEKQAVSYRALIIAGPSDKGQELAAKVNGGEELTWEDLDSANWSIMGTSSPAGYIYPALWLQDHYGKGISDLSSAVQSDSYASAFARLASGQVDVLVTYADARRDYAERWNTEFNREASIWEETNVIGVTAPIYNDTISVSKNSEIMDDALIAALQNAFINIGNTDEGKQVIAIYSHNGYQKAQSSDYDNERAAQKLIQELTAAN